MNARTILTRTEFALDHLNPDRSHLGCRFGFNLTVLIYPTVNAEMTEAEVRLGIVDPVIKGLARCTGTTLAAEVSVSRSDTMDDSLQASMSTTPKQQKTLSMNIVPD